jgi:hypothetical protein
LTVSRPVIDDVAMTVNDDDAPVDLRERGDERLIDVWARDEIEEQFGPLKTNDFPRESPPSGRSIVRFLRRGLFVGFL